jgi:diketogulonate reductase-like aldo/keto reductase
MEDLVMSGKVKNIGVSNFNIDQLRNVLAMCKIKPITNQIEINPYNQSDDLVEFCQHNQIAVTAYGSIGSGQKNTYMYLNFKPRYDKI